MNLTTEKKQELLNQVMEYIICNIDDEMKSVLQSMCENNEDTDVYEYLWGNLTWGYERNDGTLSVKLELN